MQRSWLPRLKWRASLPPPTTAAWHGQRQLAAAPGVRATPDLPCAALFDRTADVDYAARQIWAACAAYGVGPALATDQRVIPVERRYTTSMFSRPRPEMITTIQAGKSGLKKGHVLGALSKKVVKPLLKARQGPGTSMGFFEQGILVGLVFIVIPVVSVAGFSV
ncbi:uncharacterized protein BO95DRAFT_464062 [Aspergillus brunneoviolaceus CBS 621.78]|uniref:Uncharacterized protein n=1 Tax=Aspergillus brunneoviolaceus CBS 621.78 TaxID=1450534 RepID=A0ACD1G7N8_9EURO|nr:hypothetical protein BO95DRAFT_464062 [Aspergillus brunneoviolaceus CBS 621.78]RAH45249.1 hypothetical protein BO95DRAFT_464062 [Aspergillus brunneoviolaceus CBS 621.78]